MRKQLVITKLFDTGGSNSYLKLLFKYFGEEKVILGLENYQESIFLSSIIDKNKITYINLPKLRPYAHLQNSSSTNLKEASKIFFSIIKLLYVLYKHKIREVTISMVEPEKFLYFFWIPFIKITYILHTEPEKAYTYFTTFTCNQRLSHKKRVVVVSHSMQKLILENWSIKQLKSKYIHVIYNSTLESSIPVTKNSNITRTITTIGRLDSNKNPKIWLEAASQITAMNKDVFFIWLGNGEELQRYKSLTKHNNQISFLGLVNDVQKYLISTDIYYQPSLRESHGIAVLEAMFNGIPCVVSDTGGLKESIKNSYNGFLVDPLNVDEHIMALNLLLSDEYLRLRYGQNSKLRYQSNFSFTSFTKKMDMLYNTTS